MGLADETDAVQLVIDILNDTAESDWSNDGLKPPRIEHSGHTSPKEKANYESDAVYVYSLGEAEKRPLDGSGDTKIEEGDVAVEVWTLEGEARASALAGDVENNVDAYWTDNKDSTEWVTIRGTGIDDSSQETFNDETRGMHDRQRVRVSVMRSYPVGG
jgi:hypothetical protein